MKWKWLWIPLFICGLCGAPAKADNRIIVRTTLGLQGLQAFCNSLPLLQTCTVVGGLDGALGQLFLITTPVDLTTFLNLLSGTVGIVDAEADQLLNLVGGQNQVTTTPAGLSDTTPVSYSGATVWDGYVNQPAATKVGVSTAHTTFGVMGTGVVADIDTGVDPNHPALKRVLLPGYDFTRNQPGGSEMTDYSGPPPSGGPTSAATVNQSTAAVLDQSTAAVLDAKVDPQYAAFGHGTMVMGIIHLVSPSAQLLPLKAFSSDGTGYLSNILHAIYYGVQSGTNVINMSFDVKLNSSEFSKAMNYANQNGVICAASAGNDGVQETVYPAAYQGDVMGVASTTDTDSRSSFSNYGNAIVWVAAPGEGVVSTYPFSTYAAGWGTSFSAPFVSGAGALLLNLDATTNESKAAAAVAHAAPVVPDGTGMGNGRLDLPSALKSVAAPPPGNTDFAVSVRPGTDTITAGQSATFTVSVTPSGGFNHVVAFSCSGMPTGASCTVAPSSVTLDGTNASSVNLVVMTTQRSGFIVSPRLRINTRINPWGGAALLVALILLWVCFSKLHKEEGGTLRLLLPCSALFLAALCCSCGGGGVVPPTPGKGPSGGTPAGTYPIVVTGTSGNVSHAVTAQLTVN
ncbi:MAG TPA: S8 family serine peptidase [Candidatus Dormibacteraeota bacterium]|nr:S8 family serine peptidase [Candidatus Dormibacteraeota bacterium]